MKITFWGTRGSISQSSAETLGFGGNTSCVEIRSQSGTLMVIDCGTGGYPLGQSLMAEKSSLKQGHLLISHTHWDHIQGIPFFAPLFDDQSSWKIYAPGGLNQSLRDTLSGQLNYTYSPISLGDMGAKVEFQELVEGIFTIGDVTVKTHYLNHPALTLGYRLEADGVSVVYACDHEPVSKKAIPSEQDLREKESEHIGFLKNADLVIHDAQYIASEYSEKVGWGHSTLEYAIAACVEAGVKRLVFTHHDPARSDENIQRMVSEANQRLELQGHNLVVEAAAEQLLIEVLPSDNGGTSHHTSKNIAIKSAHTALRNHELIIGTLGPEADRLIRSAANAENLKIITSDEFEALDISSSSDDSFLIIVDTSTPLPEIQSIANKLQAQQEKQDLKIPMLMITYDDTALDDSIASIVATIVTTDWLSWPLSEQYIRTKLRAWVLRNSCRWQPARPPGNEKQRLNDLHNLNILHTQTEERFDRITRLASESLKVPIALISLVDKETQWFKSCIGLNTKETSREVAFCAHAILKADILIVTDTLLDDRFADNPLVTGPPHIRFYAGYPIMSPNNSALGTLCLIDTKPRNLDKSQQKILQDLAAIVENEISSKATE